MEELSFHEQQRRNENQDALPYGLGAMAAYLLVVGGADQFKQLSVNKDVLLNIVDGGDVDKDTAQRLIKMIRQQNSCLLYTSPSPRDATLSRMPSSA